MPRSAYPEMYDDVWEQLALRMQLQPRELTMSFESRQAAHGALLTFNCFRAAWRKEILRRGGKYHAQKPEAGNAREAYDMFLYLARYKAFVRGNDLMFLHRSSSPPQIESSEDFVVDARDRMMEDHQPERSSQDDMLERQAQEEASLPIKDEALSTERAKTIRAELRAAGRFSLASDKAS